MKGDYDEEVCNTRLGLAIGSDNFVYKNKSNDHQLKSKNKRAVTCLDLSFPLDHNFKNNDDDDGGSSPSLSPSPSPSPKEENINGEDEGLRLSTNSSCSIDIKEDNKRKKLRLNLEQSCVLENCFKQHSTLNMAQKYALAEKLNLKPRQIEVWFQNRRARTKLKEREVKCVFLKKCCENLREENNRLKKELEELRSLIIKRGALCHSCQQITKSPEQP